MKATESGHKPRAGIQAHILETRAQARCAGCPKPAPIAAICHHCGKPMCQECCASSPPVRTRLRANPEFAKIRPESDLHDAVGAHCHDCVHSLLWYGWILIRPGAVLAVLGLLLALNEDSRSAGILISMLGLALLGAGIYFQRTRYDAQALTQRPPLPLIPLVAPGQSLSLIESVQQEVTLDSHCDYRISVPAVKGKVVIPFTLTGGDRDAYDAYKHKFRLPDGADIMASAGFVVLNGPGNVEFTDRRWLRADRVNILELTARVSELPFITRDSDTALNLTYEEAYSIEPDAGGQYPWKDSAPCLVIPSFASEGGRRSVEIEVQLAETWVGTEAQVEFFEVYVPAVLGRVEQIAPQGSSNVTIPVPGGQESGIVWRNVPVDPVTGHARFYARFKEPPVAGYPLRGRFRVTLANTTLSGFKGLTLFSPMGYARKGYPTRLATHIDVLLSLDISGLPYQDLYIAETAVARDRVIPEYQTVHKIAEALTAADFYIKRLIENPPRPSAAGAHILNRYWDIAGRQYIGVYPVDFHLVITGEEIYGQGTRPTGGNTKIDISVQGLVTNEDMRRVVERAKSTLEAIVQRSLSTMPLASPIPEPTTGIEVPPSATGLDEESVERIRVLRDRLDKLDEALLSEKISEQMYRELRERYTTELSLLETKSTAKVHSRRKK